MTMIIGALRQGELLFTADTMSTRIDAVTGLVTYTFGHNKLTVDSGQPRVVLYSGENRIYSRDIPALTWKVRTEPLSADVYVRGLVDNLAEEKLSDDQWLEQLPLVADAECRETLRRVDARFAACIHLCGALLDRGGVPVLRRCLWSQRAAARSVVDERGPRWFFLGNPGACLKEWYFAERPAEGRKLLGTLDTAGNEDLLGVQRGLFRKAIELSDVRNQVREMGGMLKQVVIDGKGYRTSEWGFFEDAEKCRRCVEHVFADGGGCLV